MSKINVEKFLSENYCAAFDNIQSVDKERYYSLYKTKVFSKTERKSKNSRIIIAAVIFILIGLCAVSAAANYITLKEVIRQKAERLGVHFTDSELDAVTSELEQHPSYRDTEYYMQGIPQFGENENGQKYGSLEYGLELFTVASSDSNGNIIKGYCYTDDFWNNTYPDFERYDDVLVWQEDRDNGLVRNWIYVFEEDGTTIAGKYINPVKKDEEEVYSKEMNFGFVTNEILAQGEYDKYIYDGYDTEQYEKMVEERTESVKKSQADQK